MANLTGTAWIHGKPAPFEPSPAVDEWQTRVGDAATGDVPKPRNTLRGVPQPWRNRGVDATLNDAGEQATSHALNKVFAYQSCCIACLTAQHRADSKAWLQAVSI